MSRIAICFSLILLTIAGRAQQCFKASQEGEVKGGEAYGLSIGQSLEFQLLPLKENWGWQAQVSPEGDNEDWAYPVTPPYRGQNGEYLGTGYGDTVRTVLGYAHSFRFLTKAEDYKTLSDLIGDVLWPYQTKDPDAARTKFEDRKARSSTGGLRITPIDFDRSGPPETVKWMRFKLEIIVPEDFARSSNFNWAKSDCPAPWPEDPFPSQPPAPRPGTADASPAPTTARQTLAPQRKQP
jgi:hypothetical protein